MGTLYLVSTPIGNMEDITLRAIRILKQVDLIAAEDTRVTRKLMSRHGIENKITSYNNHNHQSKLPILLGVLTDGGEIALVSDAGTPTLSDPGSELIEVAYQSGHATVPVPGPSAITAALATSSLHRKEFTFISFLPRKQAERIKYLESVKAESRVIVAFEAPHRLIKSLKDILFVLGDRHVTICRELTKMHEEIFRGSISESIDHFQNPRGEFTIIVAGGTPDINHDQNSVLKRLHEYRKLGVETTKAVKQVSKETGVNRSDVYKLWVQKDFESS
ncbi:MAG: 16S rRNA (cytidine(1402)-2'-O)-methyltransferase [Chloroflexota bacterium]|nr:16S rRNA (cytidine(1402)-2'-O)-methyltransferase [Chloroflexota bacterium]